MPVELREDVPLKAAGVSGVGGPRLIVLCFGALTACITLALVVQIHSGDYELVPHGGVSSDAEACSAAGTSTLKAGGRALDAAAAAALCLAVLNPHLTSLDASGSLLYWEYRSMRTQTPTLAEWGGARPAGGGAAPRLLAALAALHAERGALPWATVLQPAINLATSGFVVSEGLAAALAAAADGDGGGDGAPAAVGSLRTAPALAAYLESLQRNTSAELAVAWGGGGVVTSTPAEGRAGAWRVWAGGASAAAVRRALALALDPPPADRDEASDRVIAALQREASAGGPWPPAAEAPPASGLALVDTRDTYVASVTGLSAPFGSGAEVEGAGWRRDGPAAPLDLAPAIMTEESVCGARYVAGGASGAASAQALAALVTGDADAARAVERRRACVLADGTLAAERGRAAPAGAGAGAVAGRECAPAAVNVVRQRADALLSHADSRGGGLASRF